MRERRAVFAHDRNSISEQIILPQWPVMRRAQRDAGELCLGPHADAMEEARRTAHENPVARSTGAQAVLESTKSMKSSSVNGPSRGTRPRSLECRR